MSRYPDFDGTQACHGAPPALLAAYTETANVDPAPACALCHTCSFLSPCRGWALEHDIRGMWGGLTSEERDRGRPAGVSAPVSVSDELDKLVRIWRASESSVSR